MPEREALTTILSVLVVDAESLYFGLLGTKNRTAQYELVWSGDLKSELRSLASALGEAARGEGDWDSVEFNPAEYPKLAVYLEHALRPYSIQLAELSWRVYSPPGCFALTGKYISLTPNEFRGMSWPGVGRFADGVIFDEKITDWHIGEVV